MKTIIYLCIHKTTITMIMLEPVKIIPITTGDKTEYYLVSTREENIEDNDLCVFETINEDKISEYSVGYKDQKVTPNLYEIYRVMVTPSMLGYYTIDNGPKRIISIMEIDAILKNNGSIKIEAMDEFTHPDEYNNVSWGDGLVKPLLQNGKAVLHIDAV